MLPDDNEAIQEAFLITQLWDHQLEFVSDKKTYALACNPENTNLF